MKENGLLLEYVFDNMNDDEQVVMEAIAQNVNAYDFISDRLKKDQTIGLFTLEKNASKIFLLDDSLKYNKNFILKAINAATEKTKANIEKKYEGPELLDLNKTFHNDPEIIKALKEAKAL